MLNRSISQVPGLSYTHEYLSSADQHDLLALIDQQPWLNDLKRRVQHYGYKYEYKKSKVEPATYLGELPHWLLPLVERIGHDKGGPFVLDQVIINEYQPGQGISSHVDCIPCFGDTILSLSLGSSCIMVLTHLGTTLKIPVLLEPGSLVIMQGESRFEWSHGIPARKSDVYEGRTIQRQRRVSITLRKVIQQ